LFRTTTKPKRGPQKKKNNPSSNNATRWPWFEIENPTRFVDTREEICQETNTKSQKPSDESGQILPSLLRVGFSFSCALPMNTYLSA
jgi:acyl-homoserine lactone acylase PvdQ